jgi:hypothetical protein
MKLMKSKAAKDYQHQHHHALSGIEHKTESDLKAFGLPR